MSPRGGDIWEESPTARNESLRPQVKPDAAQ
jgi:hypothetical protein